MGSSGCFSSPNPRFITGIWTTKFTKPTRWLDEVYWFSGIVFSESSGAGAGSAWLVVVAAGSSLLLLAAAAAGCCFCRRRTRNHRTHLHCKFLTSLALLEHIFRLLWIHDQVSTFLMLIGSGKVIGSSDDKWLPAPMNSRNTRGITAMLLTLETLFKEPHIVVLGENCTG